MASSKRLEIWQTLRFTNNLSHEHDFEYGSSAKLFILLHAEGQQINLHFRFVGNASLYILTHYANPFIAYSINVFSLHDDKVSNRERRRGGQYKTAATKRLSFFLSIKAYVKRSDVAYF